MPLHPRDSQGPRRRVRRALDCAVDLDHLGVNRCPICSGQVRLELHESEVGLDPVMASPHRVMTVCSSATENREAVSVCKLLNVPPVPSEPLQSTRHVIV